MKKSLLLLLIIIQTCIVYAQVNVEYLGFRPQLLSSNVETNILCKRYCDNDGKVSAFVTRREEGDMNYYRYTLYVFNDEFEQENYIEQAADFQVFDFNSPAGGAVKYGPCITQYLFNDDALEEYIINTGELLVVNEDWDIVCNLTRSAEMDAKKQHYMIYWNDKVYVWETGNSWYQIHKSGSSRVERLSPEKETVMNSVFSLDGKPQEVPSQGFNIIRAGDSTKKVLVR